MWCGLQRLVHCVWDGWISIAEQRHCENQCLDWMDSLCWSLPQFLSLFWLSSRAHIRHSISPSTAAIFLPPLQQGRSHPFNLSTSPFFPFILSTPLPFSCVSFPLSLFHWISRQLADFIACYLDSKTYDCAASSHSVNHCVLPNTQPSSLVHMHSTHMPSWGISSAMIAGLFQTVSNVLYSVGGLRQARDRRYIRQAWWMDVVM